MDKELSDNNNIESSLDPSTNTIKKSNQDDSSDEDESFKSCNDPISVTNCALSKEDGDKRNSQENQDGEQLIRPYPPDISDDSNDSFSENGSDDIYYSEIENNENDSDISNPARENNVSTNPGEIEISFQRELLDYLGSFFNVEPRFRLRENRQSANVTEEQLNEYSILRNKVNEDLKVLGVGNSKNLASSDQNIARNLYYLLAARERGDWTSCRRYSRIIPMWSFEKKEYVVCENESATSKDVLVEGNNQKIDIKENERMDEKEVDQCKMEVDVDDDMECNTENVGRKRREKLVFKNTQKIKYLSDEKRRKEEDEDEIKKEFPVIKKIEVKSSERVQRNGVWDIKNAIYGSRWSVRRLGLEARFNAHEGCVNALDFSSNGSWIASGSDDKHLVITDWQQKRQLARFVVGHTSNVFQVRFLPGSNDLELVSCSRDSSVRYAALSSTGQLQYCRLLARHKDCCHKMDVPIDQSSLVISAGEDTRVLGSDVRTRERPIEICSVDKVPLYSISCSPVRSQEFALAGKDSRVFVFDRRNTSSCLQELCPENLRRKPHSSYHITSVAYSHDGSSLLASYNDDDIYLLSTASKTSDEPDTLHRYQGHRNVQTVTGVAFYGPKHEFVVSGSNDGHVLLWERESEALVNWFRADENGVVNVLEPHPSMPILATAGLDHDIKLWSMIAADGTHDRALPLDLPLLERDEETARIDSAWKKLDERAANAPLNGKDCVNSSDNSDYMDSCDKIPFNLRNLRVITALNWKRRDESFPYSMDNNLDNLLLADLQIFMSRRRRGENQFRGIFISDSDSADSYDSVPDLNEDGSVPGSSDRNTGNSSTNASRMHHDSTDTNRPDGCRSS